MQIGQKLDNSSVLISTGWVPLYDLMGPKGMILYFYPKDNTSGCTTQACHFRDNYALLRDKGWQVVGVSADSIKSHNSFVEKNDLPFTLIADGKQLCEDMGVWKEKSMYGKKYWGIERSTFLVDAQGVLLMAWYGVQAHKHVAEVVATIESHYG